MADLAAELSREHGLPVIDGYELKVPNWVTFPFILSGWLYSTAAFGWEGLGWSLLGTVVGLALLFVWRLAVASPDLAGSASLATREWSSSRWSRRRSSTWTTSRRWN
jgi:hypothetical protein